MAGVISFGASACSKFAGPRVVPDGARPERAMKVEVATARWSKGATPSVRGATCTSSELAELTKKSKNKRSFD